MLSSVEKSLIRNKDNCDSHASRPLLWKMISYRIKRWSTVETTRHVLWTQRNLFGVIHSEKWCPEDFGMLKIKLPGTLAEPAWLWGRIWKETESGLPESCRTMWILFICYKALVLVKLLNLEQPHILNLSNTLQLQLQRSKLIMWQHCKITLACISLSNIVCILWRHHYSNWHVIVR